MEGSDADHLRRWVRWSESHEDQVVGVNEGLIAAALLKGQKELLSQMVQSQWGSVHLFDLCLRFDHLGMALALALAGVEGCVLEDHLGPFCTDRLPPSFLDTRCKCQGWETCRFCCWAFPVEKGIWMEDWDVDLEFAIIAAERAATTSLTSALLDICGGDMEPPFRMSPKVMARLLDIAMLTGNREAAVNLSKRCELRPLRRWWGRTLSLWFDSPLDPLERAAVSSVSCALQAGATFQDLIVRIRREDIPFPQAMFLCSEVEDWQEIRHLLPQSHSLWRPRSLENSLGHLFIELEILALGGPAHWDLSTDKIRVAHSAGVDLQFISCQISCHDERNVSVTLLDVAIWCGQPDCAEACVDVGIELAGDDLSLDWHIRILHRNHGKPIGKLHFDQEIGWFIDSFDWQQVPESETANMASAVVAAGRAWLKRSWKRESSEKGIVLYQFLSKMFCGRSFPMAFVQEILTFSMPVPKIIDQLDLWEHVGGWMASICCGPSGPAAADVDGRDARVESARVEGPCASSGLHPGSSAAADTELVASDAKSTDDLLMALQASRDEVPALNIDGVCLWRLTRNATCPRVTALLLDPMGPLAALHQRVNEAGCLVNPEWNPVKVLFVPITEAQMDELQGLSEQGYELSKEYHLLALQSDQSLIIEAIRSNTPYKNRPKLKKVGPEIPLPGADAEDQDVNDEDSHV